jgi:hypothetical protein
MSYHLTQSFRVPKRGGFSLLTFGVPERTCTPRTVELIDFGAQHHGGFRYEVGNLPVRLPLDDCVRTLANLDLATATVNDLMNVVSKGSLLPLGTTEPSGWLDGLDNINVGAGKLPVDAFEVDDLGRFVFTTEFHEDGEYKFAERYGENGEEDDERRIYGPREWAPAHVYSNNKGVPTTHYIPVFIAIEWLRQCKSLVDHWVLWREGRPVNTAWPEETFTVFDTADSDPKIADEAERDRLAWLRFTNLLNHHVSLEPGKPPRFDMTDQIFLPEAVSVLDYLRPSDHTETSLPALWADQLVALITGEFEPHRCPVCELFFVFQQGRATKRTRRDAEFCSVKCTNASMSRRYRDRKKAANK